MEEGAVSRSAGFLGLGDKKNWTPIMGRAHQCQVSGEDTKNQFTVLEDIQNIEGMKEGLRKTWCYWRGI